MVACTYVLQDNVKLQNLIKELWKEKQIYVVTEMEILARISFPTVNAELIPKISKWVKISEG